MLNYLYVTLPSILCLKLYRWQNDDGYFYLYFYSHEKVESSKNDYHR